MRYAPGCLPESRKPWNDSGNQDLVLRLPEKKRQKIGLSVRGVFASASGKTLDAACSDLLSGHLATQLAVPQEDLHDILTAYTGLPVDCHLAAVIEALVAGWYPAFKAGFRYTRKGAQGWASLLHPCLILDPLYSLQNQAWVVKVQVSSGPASPATLTMSVSSGLAAVMLRHAVGSRRLKDLTVRPYDLHRMHLACRFREGTGAAVKTFAPDAGRMPDNKTLFDHRQTACVKRVFQRTCFDCGKADTDCSYARHLLPFTSGVCAGCGRTELVSGLLLCRLCTERRISCV